MWLNSTFFTATLPFSHAVWLNLVQSSLSHELTRHLCRVVNLSFAGRAVTWGYGFMGWVIGWGMDGASMAGMK